MLRTGSPQKHCTEEQLLAFLDRELRPEIQRIVEEHVSRCWQCRGKMSELEQHAEELAALFSESGYLDDKRLSAAKAKFLAATAQAKPQPPDLFSPMFRKASFPLWRFRLSVCAAALVIVSLAFWNYSRWQPDPMRVMNSAIGTESTLLQQPVHQQFQLQLTEYRPKRVERTSTLEIWSEAPKKRFASKWQAEGQLKYAVWQPDVKTRYRYDQVRHRALGWSERERTEEIPIFTVVKSRSGLADLQACVALWITGRQWQPLSLARDFSLFVSSEGALLRSERRIAGNRQMVLITATTSQRGERLTMTLEVDQVTHETRAQEVLFESGNAKVALRIVASRLERLPAAKLIRASFEPDVPFLNAVEPKPILPAKSRIPAVSIPPVFPTRAEVLAAAIKIEYELYRQKAHDGESIAVSTEGNGRVTVTGLVSDEVHKEALLHSLESLSLPAWVKYDIETVDAAARRQSSGASTAASGLDVQFSKGSLPLDAYLVQYFTILPDAGLLAELKGTLEGAQTPQQFTSNYSSLLVAVSQQSSRQAWAIRRLAEKFSDTEALDETSRRLLGEMVRAHARELYSSLARTGKILEPVFVSTAQPQEPVEMPAWDAGEWPSAASRLFANVDKVSRTLFDIFASGTVRERKEKDPRQTMADVVGEIAALKRELLAAEALDFDRSAQHQARLPNETSH